MSSFDRSSVRACKLLLSLCSVSLCTLACSAAPNPAAVPAAPASAATAAAATADAQTSATRAALDVASASPAQPPPLKPAAVPNWTFNGSDPSRGEMVLRCENAFPPDDHSGKCVCEGYELNVCVDGIRQLSVDRKQCGFVCKPTAQSARKVALRCPDGAGPEASAQGCTCSGRKPFDPCAGGIASAKVTAGECVVTCKQDQ